MTRPSAAQQACPARQVCGLTRDCTLQFVRRLTTNELAFLRFVTPRNVCVNDKNKRDDCRKAEDKSPWPCRRSLDCLFQNPGPLFSPAKGIRHLGVCTSHICPCSKRAAGQAPSGATGKRSNPQADRLQ